MKDWNARDGTRTNPCNDVCGGQLTLSIGARLLRPDRGCPLPSCLNHPNLNLFPSSSVHHLQNTYIKVYENDLQVWPRCYRPRGFCQVRKFGVQRWPGPVDQF